MVPRVPPRPGALCALAAVVLWLVLFLVGVALTPGYAITENRISDLGNPNNPAPWTLDIACIVAGLLFLPFAWALGEGMSPRMRLPGSIMFSLASAALIGVGAFPEESPYELHFIFSALFFVLFTMAISHYAVAMWRNPGYGKISGTLGVIASGFALLFIEAVLIETLGNRLIAGGAVANVLEHLTVFAGLAWAAWNASRLLQMARKPEAAGT